MKKFDPKSDYNNTKPFHNVKAIRRIKNLGWKLTLGLGECKSDMAEIRMTF